MNIKNLKKPSPRFAGRCPGSPPPRTRIAIVANEGLTVGIFLRVNKTTECLHANSVAPFSSNCHHHDSCILSGGSGIPT